MAASSLVYNEQPKTVVGSFNDHFVGIKLEELKWHPTYNTIRTQLCANAREQRPETINLAEAMNCRYQIMLHVGYLVNKIKNEVGVTYAFADVIIDMLCRVSRYKVDLEDKLDREEPDNIGNVTLNTVGDYVCYMLINEGGGKEDWFPVVI